MPQDRMRLFVVTLVLGDNEIADSAPESATDVIGQKLQRFGILPTTAKAIGLREKLAGRFRRELRFLNTQRWGLCVRLWRRNRLVFSCRIFPTSVPRIHTPAA